MTILFRYIIRLASLPGKLGISLISTTKWDAFLTIIPGLLMVGHGTKLLEDKDRSFYLDIVCNNTSCTVSLLPKLLVFIGIVLVFSGTFRFSLFTLHTMMNTASYVSLHIILMFINIIFVLSMAMALDELVAKLEPTMMQQLPILHQKDQIFTASSLIESWDHIQMKMGCCGVKSYKDYIELPGASLGQDAVPRTCCSLKGEELPTPDNLAQCQMDAKMNVYMSKFLFTEGCMEGLKSWLYEFVHHANSIFIGTIFCQGLGAAHALWVFIQYSDSPKITKSSSKHTL